MSELKKRIAGDFLAYTTATYVTQVLGIVTSFAIRYFLGPDLMGKWSLLDLLLNYGLYANLGVLAALTTELPYFAGKGEAETVRDLRRAAFSFSIVSSTIVAAGFLAWALFRAEGLAADTRAGLAMLALILVATTAYNFHISLGWAEKRFGLLSKAIVLNAVLFLAFIALLAPRFGLGGLLLAVLFSTGLSALFLHAGEKPDLKFLMNRDVLAKLFKAGLPLMAVGFSYTFFMGLDRVLIARFLGVTWLGHYSIAILVMGFANAVPKLFSIVVFPSMQESFGRTASLADAGRFVTKPVRLLAYGTPVILGAAYFTVPLLVTALLPKFEPGLPALRICLIGSFFLCVSQPIQNYLVTVYKRLHNIPIILLGAAATSAVSVLLIGRGAGIAGVALGMSAGLFVYTTALFFYVYRHFVSGREALKAYGEVLACFAYFAAAATAIEAAIRLSGPLETALLRCAAFAVAAAPLVWMAERRTGGLSVLWAAMRDRVRRPRAKKEVYETGRV